jgi:hypothetical protein
MSENQIQLSVLANDEAVGNAHIHHLDEGDEFAAISDTASEIVLPPPALTLDAALAEPVPETDDDPIQKMNYVRRMQSAVHGVARKTTTLIRRMGTVLRELKESRPHGNAEGQDRTWQQFVEEDNDFGFGSVRTADRYIDVADWLTKAEAEAYDPGRAYILAAERKAAKQPSHEEVNEEPPQSSRNSSPSRTTDRRRTTDDCRDYLSKLPAKVEKFTTDLSEAEDDHEDVDPDHPRSFGSTKVYRQMMHHLCLLADAVCGAYELVAAKQEEVTSLVQVRDAMEHSTLGHTMSELRTQFTSIKEQVADAFDVQADDSTQNSELPNDDSE